MSNSMYTTMNMNSLADTPANINNNNGAPEVQELALARQELAAAKVAYLEAKARSAQPVPAPVCVAPAAAPASIEATAADSSTSDSDDQPEGGKWFGRHRHHHHRGQPRCPERMKRWQAVKADPELRAAKAALLELKLQQLRTPETVSAEQLQAAHAALCQARKAAFAKVAAAAPTAGASAEDEQRKAAKIRFLELKLQRVRDPASVSDVQLKEARVAFKQVRLDDTNNNDNDSGRHRGRRCGRFSALASSGCADSQQDSQEDGGRMLGDKQPFERQRRGGGRGCGFGPRRHRFYGSEDSQDTGSDSELEADFPEQRQAVLRARQSLLGLRMKRLAEGRDAVSKDELRAAWQALKTAKCEFWRAKHAARRAAAAAPVVQEDSCSSDEQHQTPPADAWMPHYLRHHRRHHDPQGLDMQRWMRDMMTMAMGAIAQPQDPYSASPAQVPAQQPQQQQQQQEQERPWGRRRGHHSRGFGGHPMWH